MMMVDRLTATDDEPVDNLIIYLRSYVTGAPPGERKSRSKTKTTSDDDLKDIKDIVIPDWVLIFDCETAITPDQRLRFGYYQLRHRGRLWEHGFFYDPSLSAEEINLLARTLERRPEKPLRAFLKTRADFVDDVFYGRAYAIGAMIVGFNLPFDISRLAIKHVPARYDMHGGFSFTLSEEPGNPPVAVKHISQSAAFIHFTGFKPEKYKDEEQTRSVERGFFVDVKTLAKVLTAVTHSLGSLSTALKVRHAKQPSIGHGRKLTKRYIRYCMRDVQSTWECFEKLAKRYAQLGLRETAPWQLYSEASLGKAYLKAMRIKPWQKCQPNFRPDMIGKIMSTYYGGRAEVHIRRQIVPIIHCDFLSMYPTVCTLMGLWLFVTAQDMICRDGTQAVRALLGEPVDRLIATFQDRANWQKLRHCQSTTVARHFPGAGGL